MVVKLENKTHNSDRRSVPPRLPPPGRFRCQAHGRLFPLLPTLILAIILGLLPAHAPARTPNTPVIDGVITLSEGDWDADEKVVSESLFDSAWGQQNDIGDLFLTWDRDNLYLGCRYVVRDNALLLCFEAGTSLRDDGIANLNEVDWYPRNFTFLTMHPEYIVGLWNADLSTGGVRHIVYDHGDGSVKTEAVSYSWATTALSGEPGDLEISIPWDSIYADTQGAIPDGAALKIVGLIAGSDYAEGGDSVPDNAEVTSGNIVSYFTIDPDTTPPGGTDHGEPDSDVSPAGAGQVQSLTGTRLELHSLELTPRCLGPGMEGLTVSLDLTSNIVLHLIVHVLNERGEEVYTTQTKISPPEAELRFTTELSVPLTVEVMKPGIHFCRIVLGTYRAETKSFLVVR